MTGLIKKLSNIHDALRVLAIMDSAGVFIKKVEDIPNSDYWKIECPYYVSGEAAHDLRTICQVKRHITKRNYRLLHRIFYRSTRYGYRDFFWSDCDN